MLRRLCLVVLMALCGATPARSDEAKVLLGGEIERLFDKTLPVMYPYEARRAHVGGRGIYRLYIKRDGSIRAVGVMKSTGSQFLDDSAAASLGHFHARPRGHAFEVDLPVNFSLPGLVR